MQEQFKSHRSFSSPGAVTPLWFVVLLPVRDCKMLEICPIFTISSPKSPSFFLRSQVFLSLSLTREVAQSVGQEYIVELEQFIQQWQWQQQPSKRKTKAVTRNCEQFSGVTKLICRYSTKNCSKKNYINYILL